MRHLLAPKGQSPRLQSHSFFNLCCRYLYVKTTAIGPRGSKLFPDPARYPLEHEVVRLVDEYLSRAKWPVGHYPCRVEFGARIGVPSQYFLDPDGTNGQGEPVGRARLWFNFAYLYQRPGPFLTEAVPHETAHLLAEYHAKTRGDTIEMHGAEWRDWLTRLSHRATPKATAIAGVFDDAAIRIHAGGVLYKCACHGPSGFRALGGGRGRAPKQEPCSHCLQEPAPVPLDQAPAPVREEVDFVRSYVELHRVTGWLG